MQKLDAARLSPLMRRAFAKVGMCEVSCGLASDSMLETSLRGVDSHGINLFPHYIAATQAGRINPRPQLRVLKRLPASAVVDADHAIGHHAGAFAMELACELAEEAGVGAVAVRNSTHFGAAGFFALRAARSGRHVGLAFTNADSLVKLVGGKRTFFGTNPICLAAPMLGEDPLCIDLATSTVSWNKVKNHRRSGEPLAPGLAFDERGEPTTDPHAARMLEPIGGYKGLALGMFVELLCGLLADGPAATELLPMFAAPLSERRHISHFFLALHIDSFLDCGRFKARLTNMAQLIRSSGERERQVQAPGDPEKRAFAERTRTGIPIFEEILEQYLAVSSAFADALVP